MTDKGPHDAMHWGCCLMPIIGKVLWIFGFLSFVAGVLALWQGGEFWSVSYQTWYWTALVSGVISFGAKQSRRHSCEHRIQEK